MTIDRRDNDVDLTNCDREPIHVPGRVQSFGCLIAVGRQWMVRYASENSADILGLPAAEMIGTPITELLAPSAVHDIRSRLQSLSMADMVERMFGLELFEDGRLFDAALHLAGDHFVMEFEPIGEKIRDHQSYVRPMIARVQTREDMKGLCTEAARQLRALTGFDRVMVYRFSEDGSGEVFAESVKSGMEGFLSLRFPASDIPKQARELYTRNLLRIISDVNDPTAPIMAGGDAEPLDLSMSTLRAVSPIHIEYLKNMGIGASMSVSILKRGKLWGLFACHNEAPRVLPYPIRTAAELFGELFAFTLDQREADLLRDEMIRADAMRDRLLPKLADGDDLASQLDFIIKEIADIIPHDGAVGWIKGRFVSYGDTPSENEFRALLPFLDEKAPHRVFATKSIVAEHDAAQDYAQRAAGLLSIPLSRAPGDFVVLFRAEVAKNVDWAGNPQKAVVSDQFGDRLHPRKSFEAWTEEVRGESRSWNDAELRAAEAFRTTLVELVLRIADRNAQARARDSEKQELLIAELNHRVRNILNLIRGLVQQSHAGSDNVEDFAEVVGSRIHALARAHDQITRQHWAPASLKELIGNECQAYAEEFGSRIKVRGPDAYLKPDSFTAIALVIHELLTNSVKYGALSDSSGRIDIDVAEREDASIDLHWRESGGPPVRAPTRRGFGSTIIERSIPYELGGQADVRFELTGLVAEYMVPANCIQRIEHDDSKAEPEPEPEVAASTKRDLGCTLIVEDNLIIALDAEEMLKALGANGVMVVGSVGEAFRKLDEEDVELALLDINLGNENSLPVAERLMKAGKPFIFTTGYGENSSIAEKFPGTPIVAKPYRREDLERALSKLKAGAEA